MVRVWPRRRLELLALTRLLVTAGGKVRLLSHSGLSRYWVWSEDRAPMLMA